MRTRDLKPGFFKNEVLCECDPLARLLFAALWGLADRDGRLEDRPARIKVEALPYDTCDVPALLDELAARGFILRYESQGVKLIEVCNFTDHQHPHPKEAASVLPSPRKPAKSNGRQRKSAEGKGNSASYSLSSSSSGSSGSSLPSGSSGSSDEESGEPAPPASPPPDSDAETVLTFPVTGDKHRREWGLSRPALAEYAALYPGLDVLAECRKALAWCIANAGKRKTAKGMPAFLVNWFNRSTSRGGGSNGSGSNGHLDQLGAKEFLARGED